MTGKYRILFVEDNTDTCDLMQVVLPNVEVTCVFSYDHALLKIQSEPSFDLYILDYYLPDATGLELCEAIRSANDETPIVFLTGSGWLSNADVAEAGGQRLIRKSGPNFIDEVRTTVEELMSGEPKIKSQKPKTWSANN